MITNLRTEKANECTNFHLFDALIIKHKYTPIKQIHNPIKHTIDQTHKVGLRHQWNYAVKVSIISTYRHVFYRIWCKFDEKIHENVFIKAAHHVFVKMSE